MLWAVRHECPSGARFALNCYRQWSTLVIRLGYGTGNFLFSKKVVTHGDPVAMVAYGLGILPLIRELRNSCPGITQPWYADED